MPKMKTKSGAKKRFKITGTGKVLYAQSRQAPRHDQADQRSRSASCAAPPSCSRPTATTSRNTFCPTAERASAAARGLPQPQFESVRRSAMARVKRGVTAHAKHKKVLKAAKGFYGRRKNTIRIAKQAVEKANQYAYRDRKRRKRTFRALWIQRLNAAVRPFGLTYSRFIDGLGKAGRHGRPQGAVRSRHHASRRRSRRSSRRPRPRCRRRPQACHGRSLASWPGSAPSRPAP